MDAVEQKRQIAEIGDLRSKLQAILDSASGIAIIATDLTGKITLFSKGAEQMLGYTSQEVTGQLLVEALHGLEELTAVARIQKEESAPDLPAWLDMAAEKLEPGQEKEQRWILLRKDGQKIIVDLTVDSICDQDGHVLGRVCIAKDVTKQSEAEERFRAFMAVSPAATYIKDQQGRYIYANEITQKVVGKNLSELVMLSDRDLFQEDVAERLEENDRKALASVVPTSVVETYRSTDGRTRHCQSCKFSFQTPMGQKYLGGVSVDITAQRELENQLREANEHLEIQKAVAEKALQEKGNFLACMSHEIRTPMNGVLGLLNVLLRLPDLTTYQRMLLEKIHDSSETLLLIINDILDVSKIESGKMRLEAVEFALEEVVRSATDLLRTQAEKKGIRLDLQIAILPVRRVQGDPMRLRQIITNLLSNAIKFTQCGAVRVSVRLKECAGHQAMFQFEIQDSGIGMTKEFQQRMFDQFSQADLSTAREYGGTGLGLAIVKKLIDLMEGSIHVESEPGWGTTFTFTLKLALAAVPRHSETVQTGNLESSERETELSSWRILVAEDNPINQLLARLVLEQDGMNVHIVPNGIEAVSAAQATRYDVILMDCRMPQLNGCQAAEQIRQTPGPSRNSPVIALSASAFAEDVALCYQSGMNDFIAKPFKPEILLQKCREWAGQSAKALPPESRPTDSGTPEKAAPLCIPEGFSPSLADDLIRLFLREYPGKFAELLDALRKNDREGARETAHWLRGGACRALMPTLSRHFEEIEKASCHPGHDGPMGDVESLLALFETVRNAAEVWVNAQD